MPQVKTKINDATLRKLKEALLEAATQTGSPLALECWANPHVKKVSIKTVDKKTVANQNLSM